MRFLRLSRLLLVLAAVLMMVVPMAHGTPAMAGHDHAMEGVEAAPPCDHPGCGADHADHHRDLPEGMPDCSAMAGHCATALCPVAVSLLGIDRRGIGFTLRLPAPGDGLSPEALLPPPRV